MRNSTLLFFGASLVLALALFPMQTFAANGEAAEAPQEVQAVDTEQKPELSQSSIAVAIELPVELQAPEWMVSGPIHSLEVCDPDDGQCPPGCFCVIIRNIVNCFC